MNTNKSILKALMSRNKLTRSAVAKLAGVSRQAVDGWLAPETAVCYRAMPERMIRLIELEVRNVTKI